MSNVFSERYHHPGFEGVLLSDLSFGLDFDLEWDCPSLSGSSRKHHSPFNYAFQSPRNEGTYSCFLLKDKSESLLDGSSHRGTMSHVNDIVNIQDLSSFYVQMPLEKHKSCPLLLNQSSWDGTWGQMYYDDSKAASKHFGHPLHTFIMLSCGCTLLLM